MSKIIYLAGPMTGLPEQNYPAFNAAADNLRARGHTVLNPAENPEPPCKSWLGYMKMAIPMLIKCDTIVFLPGWAESAGALKEYDEALFFKLEIMFYEPASASGMRALEPVFEATSRLLMEDKVAA